MATSITAEWCDLFIIHPRRAITIEDMRDVEQRVLEQRQRWPAGVACLTVLPPDAIPPTEQVRAFLRQMLDRLGVRALAYVVEGSGFEAATVRAVLVGLGIFQRKAYPTHVTSNLANAISWIETKLGPNPLRVNAIAEVPRVLRSLVQPVS